MSNEDQPYSNHPPRSGWVAWGVSAVNAVMGDYLRDQGNSLALDMTFVHAGRPLPVTPVALREALPQASSRVCLFVHGLGCTEGVWTFRDPALPDSDCSYGALLAADLGFTPIYVRYNTGLAVAENGRHLAHLLDAVWECYPAPIKEFVLIGHSMGGLVLRVACHEAELRGSAWVRQVSRVFYLGTPHSGADLARLGHVATDVLYTVPNPITRLIGAILDRRSRGVKDLQHGTLRDPEYDPSIDAGVAHPPMPWLGSANHYLIAGTVADPLHPTSVLFGDGLVAPPRRGAQSPHDDGSYEIPAEHIRLFAGVHHLRLVRDREVYQQIRQWCAEPV